jgi:hypothetical protein
LCESTTKPHNKATQQHKATQHKATQQRNTTQSNTTQRNTTLQHGRYLEAGPSALFVRRGKLLHLITGDTKSVKGYTRRGRERYRERERKKREQTNRESALADIKKPTTHQRHVIGLGKLALFVQQREQP